MKQINKQTNKNNNDDDDDCVDSSFLVPLNDLE